MITLRYYVGVIRPSTQYKCYQAYSPSLNIAVDIKQPDDVLGMTEGFTSALKEMNFVPPADGYFQTVSKVKRWLLQQGRDYTDALNVIPVNLSY